MNSDIKKRVLMLSKHVLKTHDTVRKCSLIFGVSKSTVHNDLSKRLKKINYFLYLKIKKILKINYKEKHIRGGNSTAKKYLNKNRQTP